MIEVFVLFISQNVPYLKSVILKDEQHLLIDQQLYYFVPPQTNFFSFMGRQYLGPLVH